MIAGIARQRQLSAISDICLRERAARECIISDLMGNAGRRLGIEARG